VSGVSSAGGETELKHGRLRGWLWKFDRKDKKIRMRWEAKRISEVKTT
jgi:hypothetical protein